jgi:hypothetical protein
MVTVMKRPLNVKCECRTVDKKVNLKCNAKTICSISLKCPCAKGNKMYLIMHIMCQPYVNRKKNCNNGKK